MIGEDWKSAFAQHILPRGWDYVQIGAVRELRIRGEKITAQVRGSELYHVEIDLKDGYPVWTSCTCPYAASGEYCKHMAAVLYRAQEQESALRRRELLLSTSLGDTENPEGELSRAVDAAPQEDLETLLRRVSAEELLSFVAQTARKDPDLERRIRERFGAAPEVPEAGPAQESEPDSLMEEVDALIDGLLTGGKVDELRLDELSQGVLTLLEDEPSGLLGNQDYVLAFDLTIEVLLRLQDAGIEDYPELDDILGECEEIWEKIFAACPESTRELIGSWMQEKSSDADGPLQGRIREAMASFCDRTFDRILLTPQAKRQERKKLQVDLADLDRAIEESAGSVASPVCSWVSTEPAVLVRIDRMRRLGASEEEVEKYRWAHRNFSVIRDQYRRQAEQSGDLQLLITLQREEKQQDWRKRHQSSLSLISLYHQTGDTKDELQERLEDFLYYPPADPDKAMDAISRIRDLCTRQEWEKCREQILPVVTDSALLRQIYAQEEMTGKLYPLVFPHPSREQLEQYGELLAREYPREVLEAWRGQVAEMAVSARSRASYNALTKSLTAMCRIPGGEQLVRQLARQWITQYPTRQVLIRDLQRFL